MNAKTPHKIPPVEQPSASERNMGLWNRYKQPPESALKTIEYGRLQGLTDINDQWRLQALTEAFGPVGTGWAYDIIKLWTEPGSSGEVCAFAHIHMQISDNGEWCGLPIHGTGGALLIKRTPHGLVTNDDAFKMAITDAISVCCKELGIGADIYLGMWESKRGASAALPGTSETVTEGDMIALKNSWRAVHEGEPVPDETIEQKKARLLRKFNDWAKPLTGELCAPHMLDTWSKEDLINCQQALAAQDTKPQPQEAE